MEFHHIGVACRDIEQERTKLEPLGYIAEGEPFFDPLQAVYGLFLTGGGPRLELLASDGTKGVLTPWLNSRVKMYHLAYTCSDLQKEITHFRDSGAKVIV
jgi:methylmalonyl-CoA/ethylmalonyl-CoA epimerase